MSVKFTDNSKSVLSAFEKAVHNGLTAVGMTAERLRRRTLPLTPDACGTAWRLRIFLKH